MRLVSPAGDINLNGSAGYEDFLIFAANFGHAGKLWRSQVDLTGDNTVDAFDAAALFASLTGLTPEQQAEVDAWRLANGV